MIKKHIDNFLTRYGFKFGAAYVNRTASFDDGSVAIMVETPKQSVDIRITASGLIRVGEVRKNDAEETDAETQKGQ